MMRAHWPARICRLGLFLGACGWVVPSAAGAVPEDAAGDWRALVAGGQLVDVAKANPAIQIELRYAGPRNCTGTALYPADFPCLIRPEIADRLARAQSFLHERGYGLKIWDAYRPPAAQEAIWKRFARRGYVADPNDGRGSLHTWGLAVDVTIVDGAGKEVPMPSEFDDFTTAASGIYRGKDMQVLGDLRLLQAVMRASGFIALSTEWWHFAARDWTRFGRLKLPGAPPPPPPDKAPAPAVSEKKE